MKLRTILSEEEFNEAVASEVCLTLRNKPDAVLGLPTGATPVGMYSKLAEWVKAGKVSFKAATTFNLDEYVGLPAQHPQSYAWYMSRHFVQHVDLPVDRFHIPNGMAENLDDECLRYDNRIQEAGGIELMILGIGYNGHVGFNEPGSLLLGRTHVCELAQDTRAKNARFFNSLDQVPAFAITMGMEAIMKARRVMLICAGEGKKKVLQQCLNGTITTELPASLLQLHPDLTVMTDFALDGRGDDGAE